ADETGIRPQRIELLGSTSQPISLNTIVDSGIELLDLQAEDQEEDSLPKELLYWIPRLHPQEQKVIKLRYWQNLTYQAISETLKLSFSQIRQIHKIALEHLRKLLSGEADENLEIQVCYEPVLQWPQFVYAKFILAAGLSGIFQSVIRSLKRVQRRTQQKSSIQSPEMVQPNSAIVWPDAIPFSLHSVASGEKQANHHQADSGGLRDGPKRFLDHCWHGLGGLAQFLGYWTGPPCRSGQPRHHFRNYRRGRGQLKGCCEKEKLISKIYRKVFLIFSHQDIGKRGKQKIKYSNNIVQLSRNSIFSSQSFYSSG
ncbi:MAG: sigma-70 family RNA polymerase sigma factor, partial [Acaryochloris sp. RU_4_1]|nr:sigma-70 family RNA polymerase sigma factor [Acaryochloris sp. RU_4_1]NJR56498.1 sigma-70 family RNA polymerase sigma factor [Acaryochloris sp. CRU_2_0]